MNKPIFPLIMYHAKGANAYGNMSVLSTVGSPFIDEEWWRVRKIIDSELGHFEITGIDVVGNGSWWPQILTKPSRRIFKIKYHFNKLSTLDLDTVKDIVTPCLKSEHLPWAKVRDSANFTDILEEMGIEL